MRNDGGCLFGYFRRYFVRYFAGNKDSFLSGYLPSNESGSIPSSLPSYSPLSRPSSFPEYSAGNLDTNVWSFLERNEEGSGVRCDWSQTALDAAGPGSGITGNEKRESRRTPAG